jgi:alkylhydroperoxidase family enzyme
MKAPRISYVEPSSITDAAMLAELDRCRREGTPRPESQAVRAHVPAVFWAFANSWRDVFKNGVADHAIKELCRIYVSRSVKCEYCGNQRSMKAATQGVVEDDYLDLLNFEKSTRYSDTQKAALAWAETITWDLPVDDKLWTRLHEHFSEPELVEIGFRAHNGPAEVAQDARHRASSGAGRNRCLDGTGIRNRGSAEALQDGSELLGRERGQAAQRGSGVTSTDAPANAAGEAARIRVKGLGKKFGRLSLIDTGASRTTLHQCF